MIARSSARPRADAGELPFRPSSPILVLVAEVSEDSIIIDFPCCPDPTPKESPGWVDEWYRSGKFNTIIAWLDRHCAPNCMCDECGDRMAKRVPKEDESALSYLNLMFLTAFGSKAYFLCEFCSEKWRAFGLDALPNVTAKATAGIDFRDYRKRANA